MRHSHIVDIAESTCFALFGVVETSGPIDSNVGGSVVQFLGGTYVADQLHYKLDISGKGNLPREPPAEMEQNSNNPSKAGQSSPTRPTHRLSQRTFLKPACPESSSTYTSDHLLSTYLPSPA